MTLKLTDKVYEFLKWTALIFLPACSVLYLAIAKIWDLGYVLEVTGTIEAVDIFIGTLIGISTKNYNEKK